MIFLIDFDQTLCDTELLLGEPVRGAIEWTKRLQANCETILWTNRVGPLRALAESWCKHYGLQFRAVNTSVHWYQRLFISGPKPYFHHAIDDRNIGCPLIKGIHNRLVVDWDLAGPLAENTRIRETKADYRCEFPCGCCAVFTGESGYSNCVVTRCGKHKDPSANDKAVYDEARSRVNADLRL